jgi:hypothetical protein
MAEACKLLQGEAELGIMRAGLNFDGPPLTRAARARVRGRGARIATAQIACKVERLVGVNETALEHTLRLLMVAEISCRV